MEYKTFKQDLTYSCKKFAKEGKTLVNFDGNLSIDAENKFVSDTNYLDVLEMFILVKGYVPTNEMTLTRHEQWIDPQGGTHHLYWKHPDVFNINLIDVIVEQAQIAREDVYAFLDGFENIIGDSKNEFYNTGVYIREKFQPLGCRTEPLRKQVYEINSLQGRTVMKKFVIHSLRGKISIVEAEHYLLSRLDDPMLATLPEGEYRARITAPEILFEKKATGFIPATYHSFALYDTFELARAKVEQDLRAGFERNLRKHAKAFTEADVQSAVADVKVIML